MRAAVHEGQCLALTRSARIEYFGRTVHRAAALLGCAAAGQIALSVAVASDRTALALLHELDAPYEVTTSCGGPYSGTRITLVRAPRCVDTSQRAS